MRRYQTIVCSAAVAATTALAAALAAGCHDLPDPRTCGNRITEEANGEACDDGPIGSDACTPACALLCTETAFTDAYVEVGPKQFCPGVEFRCGGDGLCRAPSGRFAELSDALPFNIGDRPTTGDVNNDGLADLIGTSTTSLYVRFASDAGTPLGQLLVQDAPSSDAAPLIFDPRPNTRSEVRSEILVAIPTEGIALLQSDDERFVPELELPITVPGAGAVGLVVRDPGPPDRFGDVVVSVTQASTGPEIEVARVEVQAPDGDSADPSVPFLKLPSCTGTVGGPWRLVDLEPAADRRSFVVVIQRTGADLEPWHLCRYTHAAGAWVASQQAFAPEARLEQISLANLDAADACLELVLRGTAGFLSVDAGGAGCGFAAATEPLRVELPADNQPRPLLAAGPLVDGGVDELVLANGVHRKCTGIDDCGASMPGTFVPVAEPSSLEWVAAAVVDLNGDGALDVVAGRAAPNLDIVRGGASPNVYSVGSTSGVRGLVAGDFDGDRLGDVAIAERAMMGADSISVLFGAREATVAAPRVMSGPRMMGGPLLLDRFTAMSWLPSSRGTDGIDDLAVVQLGGGTGVRAGFMLGDAARLMTTPRLPPTATKRTTLAGVAAGAFRTGEVELLAFTGDRAVFYNVTSLMSARWSAPSSPGPTLASPVAALRDGPRLARGVARVVEPDRDDQLAVFSVEGGTMPPGGRNTIRQQCTARTAGLHIRELRALDLDGDGVDEVAAVTEGRPAMPPQPAQDGPGTRSLEIFGADCRPLVNPALAGCVDVARAGSGLVALCRAEALQVGAAREVYAIPDGGQERLLMHRFLVGDARYLTPSDFDGDGVVDLALTLHRVNEVFVHYLRQCPAHDTRDCPLPERPGN